MWLAWLVAKCVRLISKCAICKKIKKTNKPNYDKMPVKTTEATPWVEVNVELVGPYTIKTQKWDSTDIPSEVTLVVVAFINPVTGWFEISKVPYVDQSSVRISQLFNQI